MNNVNKYSGSLDFLNNFTHTESDEYKNISFFISNFEDDVWIFKFTNKDDYKVDFKVLLSDKSFLTDNKNKRILNSLKDWILNYLCEDKHYLNTAKTIKLKISLIVRFFDVLNYFDDGTLVKNSLKCLTKDRLFFVINKLSLKEDVFSVDENVREYIESKNLSKRKFISNKSGNKELFSEIYPNLIIKPNLKHCSLEKRIRLKREYDSYFRNNTEHINENMFAIVKDILKYMPYSSSRESEFPFKENIEIVLNHNFEAQGSERFETYPSKLIFKTFKNATEFHLKYGSLLVDEYLKIIELKNSNPQLKLEDMNKEFCKISSKEIQSLGVKIFHTEGEINFNNLRNNYSFYDLIRVYYGCVQFVTGALMGRRVSELLSLQYGQCIDKDNELLLFKRSKSAYGLFGVKDYIALPVDSLVIEMITNLEKIIEACNGNKNGNNQVFAIPSGVRINEIPVKLYDDKYHEALDLMHDYFEVDVVEEKRMYIRQHQLRRFFAMTFFWSNGFGSMDTLRWFMGHTDIEHLYHYITETESGEVLRSVKAQFVAENIKDYYEDLRDFIKNKYNTDNFQVLKKSDLIDLIEVLQEEKKIVIEPEFFKDDKGQNFNVIIKIKE